MSDMMGLICTKKKQRLQSPALENNKVGPDFTSFTETAVKITGTIHLTHLRTHLPKRFGAVYVR